MQLVVARQMLLTLAYSEQFSFPLNTRELYVRLLSKKKVYILEFFETLQYLVENKFIYYVEGYFFISGMSRNKMKRIVMVRKNRALLSLKKWEEVTEFIQFIQSIPFISGVAVTGSLAMQNVVKDDDIDFMIVTPHNRLWISRLLVICFASLKGKRRSFAKEEKNSWCFNLWVEETDLQLPRESRSVYTAYEVMQADWVFSRHKTAEIFRKVNSWIGHFIFHSTIVYSKTLLSSRPKLNEKSKMSSFFWLYESSSCFFDCINMCVFWLQYIYMKPHMTREKVSKSHAFFHPRNTKFEVFKNWKKTLLRLKQ